MSRYKPEKDTWLAKSALHYLLNFLRYAKGPIEDSDTFAAPARLLGREEAVCWYLTRWTDEEREEIEEEAKGRDAICVMDPTPEFLRCLWTSRVCGPVLRRRLESLEGETKPGRSVFRRRFREYTRMLGLTPLERELLLVGYLLWTDLLAWPSSMENCGGRLTFRIDAMARFVDRGLPEVRAALIDGAPLRRFGLLDEDLDFNSEIVPFLDGLNKEPVAGSLFRKDGEAPLPWNWFGPLAERHGALLRRLLSGGSGPANILLHGAPGTGKTSFARALAAETGRTCWFVAQNPDRSRGRQGAMARFGALRACDGTVDPERSLIVVDEADDMLAACGGDEPNDKGSLNAMLDSMRTPTIWICNAPARRMDESNRRRFDYSIRFDALTDTQRAGIWRNQIARSGLGGLLPSGAPEEWASRWPTSAGGIATVLRNVARLRPAAAEAPALVEQFMAPHCDLMGLSEGSDRLRPARDYSLEGLSLSSSVPLPRIIDAARAFRAELEAPESARGLDAPRFNLLLSGPPGTGKTEFVKHLAERLGAKILVRMGADLLSMYVGGTEENIAAAFREAEAEKALLFLDEADGLLRSRAAAERSWEVTQVNELLHRMENFRGVLVCATNFAEALDPATVRRFTFKVAFDYLGREGKEIFFDRIFGVPLSAGEREELAAIPDLAPGDFRTVRQGLRYLGGSTDAAALLRALRDESDAKRERGRRRRLGFAAGA